MVFEGSGSGRDGPSQGGACLPVAGSFLVSSVGLVFQVGLWGLLLIFTHGFLEWILVSKPGWLGVHLGGVTCRELWVGLMCA